MLTVISQKNDLNQHGDFMDNLENNYVDYFEQFNIKLLIIPNTTKNIDFYFKKFPIERIILSGGNDIDPEAYGQKKRGNLSLAKLRDKTEKRLLTIALQKKLPVLGICRGMQFINVFFKGKLINLKHHVACNHPIQIDRWGGIKVNSYHNQGMNEQVLSPKLKSFAQSPDRIIEGIYHPNLPLAGIQWHPERKSPDKKINAKLINAFLKNKLFWQK